MIDQEAPRVFRFRLGFAGEPEEAHDVTPYPHPLGFVEILDGDVDLGVLLHQLDDAFVGRLQPEIKRPAPGLGGEVPHLRLDE